MANPSYGLNKIEFADPLVGPPVEADWYQTTNEANDEGTTTLTKQIYSITGTSETEWKHILDLTRGPKNAGHKYMRVSAAETLAQGYVTGTLSEKVNKSEQENIK